MTRKLIVGLAATLVAAFSVSAQFSPTNARIGSIGGIYTVKDISNIYRYAAHMSKYTDDIQVTFSTPILGIKSIGDMLSIGGYVRPGLVLNQSFYTGGRNYLNFALNPDISDPTYIPHALLGFKLGALTIGFDLFMEWANTSSKAENTVGSVTTKTEINSTLRNPGFIGSMLLDINSFPVSLKAGLAFPGINGSSETSGSGASLKTEYKSDKGIYMEFGGEIGLPVSDANLTAGADYIIESYAFKTNSEDPSNEYTTNRLAIFGGFENKVFDNGLWATLYQLKIKADKNDARDSTVFDSTITTVDHVITTGVENGWDNVWLFDKVFCRGGIGLNVSTTYGKLERRNNKASGKEQKMFSAEPTVGFGVNKGPFELDLRVIMTPGAGGWDKIITGPGVGTVTGTLRF